MADEHTALDVLRLISEAEPKRVIEDVRRRLTTGLTQLDESLKSFREADDCEWEASLQRDLDRLSDDLAEVVIRSNARGEMYDRARVLRGKRDELRKIGRAH